MDNPAQLITEPLYPEIKAYPWEVALFQCRPVRRLKHLSHFGGASFLSPVVHSRFEHTVGVWKLTAFYFPNDIELRVAALLHDIGHLPFSHAMEEALDFNHHQLTETYILEPEISTILQGADLDAQKIISLLNNPSAITGKGNILGLDHLDSFLRDTYMAGECSRLPRDVLRDIKCTPEGIETDLETGNYVMKLMLADHRLFLSPIMVAIDRLMAEAVKLHWQETTAHNREAFARKTDAEVIAILTTSPSFKARKLIDMLRYEPFKIHINEVETGEGYPISIRKIYKKAPLCGGKILTELSERARQVLEDLKKLAFHLEVVVDLEEELVD
ncbi:HD domain-containing protein [Oceanobacillus kapialis]|uniref:HD domain-containing protein n=1 Tax=Oceanobacillus kapialis TaxID=481353 RepID=UPI00384FBD83